MWQAPRRKVRAAVAAGAAEIDVVFPWRAFLAGDATTALALVRACREACGTQARLKVILETGQLGTAGTHSRGRRHCHCGWRTLPEDLHRQDPAGCDPDGRASHARCDCARPDTRRARGVQGLRWRAHHRRCGRLPGGVRAQIWRRQCAAGRCSESVPHSWCMSCWRLPVARVRSKGPRPHTEELMRSRPVAAAQARPPRRCSRPPARR